MATAPVNTTQQAPVTSLSELELQIQSEQKELSRVESALSEARTKLAEMTSQYDGQLKRLANGEKSEVDIPDLKEKANVLSDVVSQMESECEAKRKTLNVLHGQLSVLQPQGTKKKGPARAALERKIETDEKERSRVESGIGEARQKTCRSHFRVQLKAKASCARRRVGHRDCRSQAENERPLGSHKSVASRS